MNIALNACPKPQHKRIKPNQRIKGSISPKVRLEVKERSNGYCEVKQRCNGNFGVHMAHITSRKQLSERTTAKDILHSCLECHVWLDTTPQGIQHKRKLEESGHGKILHEMQ